MLRAGSRSFLYISRASASKGLNCIGGSGGNFHYYNLCERYKLIHEQRIAEAKLESRFKAKFITNTALVVMPGIALLGLLLGYVLFKQILAPIRKMVGQPNLSEPQRTSLNEVQALSQKVHNLREDVDLAQSQLNAARCL